MAKKERTPFEDAAYKAFAGMPIEKWLPFIEANAKDDKETRAYKVIARRSLNYENMMDYIDKFAKNPEEEQQAFYDNSWGPKWVKDENGKFMTEADGKTKIPEKKDGKVIEIQSTVLAAKYFVETYLDGLKLEEKAPKAKATDAFKRWKGLKTRKV